jgi:hypothetical protein
MANPLIIKVKESEEVLKQYIRRAKTPTKRKRLKILVEIKKAGDGSTTLTNHKGISVLS